MQAKNDLFRFCSWIKFLHDGIYALRQYSSKNPYRILLFLSSFKVLLIYAWISLPAFVYAQFQHSGTSIVRNFSYRQIKISPALNSPIMWDATQDPGGNLYFANNDGIVSYDGINWTLIPTPRPARGVVYDEKTEQIYVACKGDMGVLVQSTGKPVFKSFRDKISRENLLMNDLENVYSADDGIYFVSSSRLYHLPGGKSNTINIAQTDSIYGSGIINKHFYVNFRKSGLKKISNGSAQTVDSGSVLKGMKVNIMGIEGQPSGIIASHSGEVFKISDSGLKRDTGFYFEKLPNANGTGKGQISKRGNFIFGTKTDGIFIYDKNGSIVYQLNEENNFPSDKINSIYIDTEGGAWIGHSEGLSYLLPDFPLYSYNNIKGLKGVVRSIYYYSNCLYVATVSGVFKLPDKQFIPIKGLNTECRHLNEVGGRLLVATLEGCYDITTGKAEPIFLENVCLKIEKSTYNPNLGYVGGSNGVHRIEYLPDSLSWKYIGRLRGVVEEISSIREINESEIWAGTSYEGLLKINFKNSKIDIKRYNSLNGFTDAACRIEKINIKGKDNFVFFTNTGVYRFINSKIKLDKVLTKAFGDVTNQITTDQNGRYWRIPKSGTLIIDPRNIAKIDSSTLINLIGEIPTNIYSAKNSVWVSFLDELIELKGIDSYKWNTSFNVNIRKITLNEDSTFFDGYIQTSRRSLFQVAQFDYEHNTISIELSASSYFNSEQNEFRYWLEIEGNDNDNGWSGWSKDSKLLFTDLPGGTYRLHIMAKNAIGKACKEKIFSFIISPPWFKTKPAYFFYVLLGGLSVLLGIKVYTSKIMADNKRLEEQVALRTLEINEKNTVLEKQKEELQNKNSELGSAYSILKENKEQIELQQNLLLVQSTDLQTKNFDLERAYDELKATKEQNEQQQAQIIQSEKLAVLGQLIAGVAHEINTPLGAINGAGKDLSDSLPDMLRKAPQFFKILPAKLEKLFFEFIEKSLQKADGLSSREERRIKKELTTQLEEMGVGENTNFIARELVRIGVYENISDFKELFLAPNATEIMDMASSIGWTKVNLVNISMAVQKTRKIVFALKSYSHHSSEKVPIDVNIIDNIEVVLTIYHNLIKTDINLIKAYEDDLPIIKGFPDELNQVWTNLILNGLQAMNSKGELRIDVFKQPADLTLEQDLPEGIVVKISDSGPGIPDDVMPRIFDAFYTTKPQGEGSGLGLSICKKIIDKHKGQIIVDSHPGKTTFTVILPIA